MSETTETFVVVLRDGLELHDVCVTGGLIYEYTTSPALAIEVIADVPEGFVGHVSIQETNGETITPCGYGVPIFVPEPGVDLLLVAGALLLAALTRGKR